MSNFLTTNEFEEALSALEMFNKVLPTINDNVYHWKWSIITLHNALQGFMVLSLRDTNGLLTLSKKSLKEWSEAYNTNQNPPKEKLDTFTGLFKKIKKHRAFESTNEYEYSINKLNSLRNELIHFTPKSWLLEISGLPQICIHTMNIIRYLFEKGQITWYEDETYERAKKLVLESEKLVHKL